jgi:transposase
MLWVARTDCPWRDLPAQFPKWKGVYTRWRIWARVLTFLAEAHDCEAYPVDATYVRVHARGTRARGGCSTQAVGRSRGGLTSKVHLLTDALGYPVSFVITGGDRNDVTQAPRSCLRARARTCCATAAKTPTGGASGSRTAGHLPVIPGRRNRSMQPVYDEFVYRSRHLVEDAFARLESACRISTRYDHTVATYSAIFALACVCL